MSVSTFCDAVAETATAVAVTAKLTPVSGNKILPPTYAGASPADPGKHNMTKPGPDGLSSWCSVDSPGSCANRAEQALVGLGLNLDPLRVDFGNGEVLSTLQLPHRVFDAVLRDSQLNGIAFRQTEIGRAVIAATPAHASALLHADPGSLVFGAWDSTELGSAKGPRSKWARAITCEISATRVESVALGGNRLDPIGIEGNDPILMIEADGTLRLATDQELSAPKDDSSEAPPKASRKPKKPPYPRLVKASEANHGNTLSLTPKGVLVHGEITLNATLSLSRLRRYHFADETASGRLLIALMGLYGVLAVLNDGLALRSGCDLAVAAGGLAIELIGMGTRAPLTLTLAEVEEALRNQVQAVHLHQPVLLTPSKNLRTIRNAYK